MKFGSRCGVGGLAGGNGEAVGDAQAHALIACIDTAGKDVEEPELETGGGDEFLDLAAAEAKPAVLEALAEPGLGMLEEVVDDEEATGAKAGGKVSEGGLWVGEVMENLDHADDVDLVVGEKVAGFNVAEAKFDVGEVVCVGLVAGALEHFLGVVDGDEAGSAGPEEFDAVAGAGADIGDDESVWKEGAEDGAAEGVAEEGFADEVPLVGELVEEGSIGAGFAFEEDIGEAFVVGGELVVGGPGGLEIVPEGAEEFGKVFVGEAVVAPRSFAALGEEALVAKDLEVVGDSGLGELGDGGEFVDGEFVAGKQPKETKAGLVGENSEESGEVSQHGGGGRPRGGRGGGRQWGFANDGKEFRIEAKFG